MALLYSECHADLRVPLRERPPVRGHAEHVGRPADDLRGLRGAGPARLPPGRGALQGQGLLQHRLRHEAPQPRAGEVGQGRRRQDAAADRTRRLVVARRVRRRQPTKASDKPAAKKDSGAGSGGPRGGAPPRRRPGRTPPSGSVTCRWGAARAWARRRSSPRRPRRPAASGPLMSDFTVFGAAHAMIGAGAGSRRGEDPRAHRAEDLLLAPRARSPSLAVAEVLARAGEGERLVAVDVRLARRQAQRVAAVAEAAVDARDDAAAPVGDAAHRVDELGEALEVDLDDVVDLDAEVLLDGLDRQRGAADRVGGVDLVRARARGCPRPCRGGSRAWPPCRRPSA